jgi:hypothetical protein
MWSSLTLAAALSLGPAQPAAGGLQLTNVRMTMGELGPARKSNKITPGDVLFIGYEIDGLTIEPDGTAKYTMAMEVDDKAGKPIFKQDPRELMDFLPLRGSKLPARAFITIGLDQEPGSYTCKVTVTDPKNKATNSLSVPFEVTKREFGVVAVYTTYDADARISAPAGGVVGQTLFIQFTVVDFQRDPKTKQPDVDLEFNILDEKGQPTLAKPRTEKQDAKSPKLLNEKDAAFGMFFPLFMNRPGKFTVRITAADKVGNKKATYEVPVTIQPAP